MERLKTVNWKEFGPRMRELGYEGPFFGGKHPKMRKGDRVVIIPNQHESDIGAGFMKWLVKEAGISPEEWLKG